MIKNYVYFNGDILAQEEVKVSYLDRGLRFGDGLFETIRIYNQKPYRWNHHLKRMSSGLKYLNLNINQEDLLNNLIQVLNKNNITSGIAKILITAGEKSKGYLRLDGAKKNIVIEAAQSEIKQHKPVEACISNYRKPAKNMLPNHYKTLCNLNSVLAKEEAIKLGYQESLQLSNKDHVSEFSSGNIFWVKKGKIYTPDADCDMIPGTIRSFLIERFGKILVCGKYNFEHLKDASEIFLTNVNYLVLPVKKIADIWEGNDFSMAKEISDIIIDDIKNTCN